MCRQKMCYVPNENNNIINLVDNIIDLVDNV